MNQLGLEVEMSRPDKRCVSSG